MPKQSHIWRFFVPAILIALFVFSTPAEAGVLSFLKNVFIGSSETQIKEDNSQTVKLLEARMSSEEGSRGGGDINIVNQSALLPDSGPMGTIADIEDNAPSKDQISIYVVRKGDSITGIAKMFDVSPNTIIWSNDLPKGGALTVGQTLVILPVDGIEYTVKKGDTIASVAKALKGDVDEIIDYNQLNTKDGLAVGQKIVVPNGEFSEPSSSPKTSSIASKQKARGTNVPSYSGYYMRPISDGRKSQGKHGYNAVDLADSCGTPIFASASGDVTVARNSGYNGGYGKYVVISHPNGTQTVYGHFNDVIVSMGWHVVKGQTIGYMGSTGRSTGCHVHFEIRGAKNPF